MPVEAEVEEGVLERAISEEGVEAAVEAELETAGLVEGPDGGWGWAVVGASFLTNLIVDGVIFTSGNAFQPQWEKNFQATSSETAWTVSLLSGMYLLSGPLATVLANQNGPRVTAIIGCIMATTGFLLSIFAPALWILYLTFGIIGGIGFGLMYLPSIVIICFYFNRRRALATATLPFVAGKVVLMKGIVAAAFYRPLKPSKAQVAQVAEIASRYPDLVKEAEEHRVLSKECIKNDGSKENSPLVAKGVEIERFEAGERSAGRTRTATSEHPFMSVMELRARERNTSLFSVNAPSNADEATRREMARLISEDSVSILNRPMSRMDLFYAGSTRRLNTLSTSALDRRTGSRLASRRTLEGSVLSVPAEVLGLEEGDWKGRLVATLHQLLDMRLLRSPTFLLLAFGGFLTLSGFFGPFIYLPRHAVSIGISEENATFLVSILGIANIVFRIACGWLSDQSWVNPILLHNVALILGGVATIAVPWLNSYWLLVVYCIIFGLATAVFASLRSIMAERLMGMENLTSAYGLLMLFMGVAALIGSPLAAAVADATGNYSASFYVMGTAVALSGLISFPLVRLSRWEFPHLHSPPPTPSSSNKTSLQLKIGFSDMNMTPVRITMKTTSMIQMMGQLKAEEAWSDESAVV